MDRISALRNVEEALSDFEAGECDLATMERRIRGVLRTYATEFADLDAYRATGGSADGMVVVADSPTEARRRVRDLADDPGDFDVTRVE
ncbi:DUF7854 family protein [Halomarina litorea]|uniref:DUF7854 family protein n=1 Tax=Halomarina litorea TaxID=2961595 RepID=UPI0020C25F03|nr:hypothetical protein [Halomarina sp. BCD28]